MSDTTWLDYFERTKNNPPRSLLVEAVSFATERGEAIDLGAGALNDSRYLLDQGFQRVIALDKELVAAEVAASFPKERFQYLKADFETFDFPQSRFDVVNAEYALPFIKPDQFNVVFQKIIDSLKSGGILVGQLFGNKDGWVGNKNMNFHTHEEVKELLSPLTILHFSEEDAESPTAAGEMKHWHVFHSIARK